MINFNSVLIKNNCAFEFEIFSLKKDLIWYYFVLEIWLHKTKQRI